MSFYIFLPLITAICWGLAQVLGKKSVQSLSVNNFNIIREFIAMIFSLILVLTLSNFQFLSTTPLKDLLIAAVIAIIGTNLTLACLYQAFKYGSVSVVVVSLCSSPIFVFIYSYLFFDESITLSLTIGIILILIAIIIVSMGKGTPHVEQKHSIWLPITFAVASGACQSIMIVGNKILIKEFSYFDLYATISTVAFIGFLLIGRGKIKKIFELDMRRGVGYALLSGLIGRVIGLSCLLIALQEVSAVVVTPIVNTSMFAALFFGAVILKEKITFRHLISAIIAFVGVFLIICG